MVATMESPIAAPAETSRLEAPKNPENLPSRREAFDVFNSVYERLQREGNRLEQQYKEEGVLTKAQKELLIGAHVTKAGRVAVDKNTTLSPYITGVEFVDKIDKPDGSGQDTFHVGIPTEHMIRFVDYQLSNLKENHPDATAEIQRLDREKEVLLASSKPVMDRDEMKDPTRVEEWKRREADRVHKDDINGVLRQTGTPEGDWYKGVDDLNKRLEFDPPSWTENLGDGGAGEFMEGLTPEAIAHAEAIANKVRIDGANDRAMGRLRLALVPIIAGLGIGLARDSGPAIAPEPARMPEPIVEPATPAPPLPDANAQSQIDQIQKQLQELGSQPPLEAPKPPSEMSSGQLPTPTETIKEMTPEEMEKAREEINFKQDTFKEGDTLNAIAAKDVNTILGEDNELVRQAVMLGMAEFNEIEDPDKISAGAEYHHLSPRSIKKLAENINKEGDPDAAALRDALQKIVAPGASTPEVVAAKQAALTLISRHFPK